VPRVKDAALELRTESGNGRVLDVHGDRFVDSGGVTSRPASTRLARVSRETYCRRISTGLNVRYSIRVNAGTSEPAPGFMLSCRCKPIIRCGVQERSVSMEPAGAEET
jgi:hypothetical protein